MSKKAEVGAWWKKKTGWVNAATRRRISSG